jgi:hypothetical protein
LRESVARLSPSIHKFDDVFIHAGLSTDFGEFSRAGRAIAQTILMKIHRGIFESKYLVKCRDSLLELGR